MTTQANYYEYNKEARLSPCFCIFTQYFYMIQIDYIFQIISLIQGLNIDRKVAKRSITVHFSTPLQPRT